MFEYYLSNKAVEDLTSIWNPTYEIWSEKQADKYYFELLSDCQDLAKNQNMGRNYADIDETIFGFLSGQHIIFYDILNENEIEVVRILDSKMDLKNRIQE
jgi:toxin ParE1/3/4